MLCLLLTADLLAGCSGVAVVSPSPGPAVAEDRAAIQRVLDRIVAADNAGDLEAVTSTYAEDAVLLPPGGEPIAGHDAIRAHYAGLFEAHQLEVSLAVEETVVSGDWAFNRGQTSVRVVPRAGGEAQEGSDKYLMVLRRQPNGEWKIARLIWNRSSSEQ